MTLESLQARIDSLERQLNQPLFNYGVAGGSGIMPSKLSATLNTGQTAALISGNTNLEEDIQDILSGAATFTNLTLTGNLSVQGNTTLGNAAADTITLTGTVTSNLIFTDNTYDIGASGATRPRNLYLSGLAVVGTSLSVGTTLTMSGGNILLGSNWLSGDGGNEGIQVSSAGLVTTSGTINSQTISSAANFTGSLTVATTLTVSGASITVGGTFQTPSGTALLINAVGAVSATIRTNGTDAISFSSAQAITYGGTAWTGPGAEIVFTNAVTDNFAFSFFNSHATNPYGIRVRFSGAAPNDATRLFLTCQDTGGERATIRSNGGFANYQANDVNLSDATTKNLHAHPLSQWDAWKSLQFVQYAYKDAPERINIGLTAQQVQTVYPELVEEFADKKLGIREQQIMMRACLVIQELQTRVETLEGR